jgi:hypothetical protein
MTRNSLSGRLHPAHYYLVSGPHMKCALPWSQAVCSVLLYAELHACTMLHARVHPRESTAGAQFSHPRTDSGIPPSRARTRRSSSSCPCPGPAFHCARWLHARTAQAQRRRPAGTQQHSRVPVCVQQQRPRLEPPSSRARGDKRVRGHMPRQSAMHATPLG